MRRIKEKDRSGSMDGFRNDCRFAVQTVTGIAMIGYEEVIVFEYLKNVRKWQIKMTGGRMLSLRSTVNSSDITAVTSLFIQVNQYCIVNIIHLTAIENKTQRCIFDALAGDMAGVTVSPLYYRKIKDMLDIL